MTCSACLPDLLLLARGRGDDRERGRTKIPIERILGNNGDDGLNTYEDEDEEPDGALPAAVSCASSPGKTYRSAMTVAERKRLLKLSRLADVESAFDLRLDPETLETVGLAVPDVLEAGIPLTCLKDEGFLTIAELTDAGLRYGHLRDRTLTHPGELLDAFVGTGADLIEGTGLRLRHLEEIDWGLEELSRLRLGAEDVATLEPEPLSVVAAGFTPGQWTELGVGVKDVANWGLKPEHVRAMRWRLVDAMDAWEVEDLRSLAPCGFEIRMGVKTEADCKAMRNRRG